MAIRFWFSSLILGVAFSVFSFANSQLNAQTDMTENAKELIAQHNTEIRPLELVVNKAWWVANTTGSDEAYANKVEAESKLNAALSDKARFEKLKASNEGTIADPLLKRQIRLLYLQALEKQVPQELLDRMSSKANEIEKSFNVFRAEVDGKSYADSDVRKVLLDSNDSTERQKYWEASKGVGKSVESNLKELVALRNAAAKQLGFADFHVMQLAINEQKQADVIALFDELDKLTREPFAAAKADIDKELAKRYGIKVEELQAWHYHDPFFQEAPNVYGVSLDEPFAKADIVKVCREFYESIGLPVDTVLTNSDLFEKPGKSPHAFCTDIDRVGDVRVLANITPSEYWMGTMLHELGHAVYSSKNIPAELPYVLRSEAHILATEGVAMMFERFSKDSDWLAAYGVEMPDPKGYDKAARMMRRNRLLIFSRWCQVMFRFEVELYKNPEQDLNKLWWDLVERYQMVKRPSGRNAPDFASKIHIVSAPAYYHNYMMGELFACQLHARITRDVLKESDPTEAIYVRNRGVGEFMNKNVFAHGKLYPWNELCEKAFGEPLNAKAFAAEFQK